MNKQELIRNLQFRIEHNEHMQAVHEEKHGEFVAKFPKRICSIDSEMADWHKGKVNAFKQVIEMLEEA